MLRKYFSIPGVLMDFIGSGQTGDGKNEHWHFWKQ